MLRAATLFACLTTLSAAAPALAMRAFEGLPVERVELTGVEDELVDELRAGLELVAKSRWLGGARTVFFVETLEADVARVRLFLARHGYPNANVIAGGEATKDDASVVVRLAVEPGAPVRVAEVKLLGIPPDLPPPRLPVAAGDVFRDEDAAAAAARLETFLRDEGHAFAEVTADPTAVPGDGVHVVLRTDAGPRYRLGRIDVHGASPDLVDLARDSMRLREGELYSPARLRRAEDGLRELDLFRLIRIDLEPESDGLLTVKCELSERLPRSFSSGVGYFSDDQVRVDASWRHRNLFRGGRGFAVGARASRFQQRLRTDVVWPGLAGGRLRGIAGAAVRREDEETYGLLDLRADAEVAARISRAVRATLGVAVSYVDVEVRTEDPSLDDPVGVVTSVPFTITRDTSNHPVYPSRGYVLRGEVEVTPPGLGSVTHYWRTEARGGAYRPLFGPTVVAARLAVGVARPFRDTQSVLASRRLYAGGSRSMRGFGRRRLGPRDDDGEALGGDYKLEASAEWRFPVWRRLEGAAFVDAGQVWTERASIRPSSLAWAAGPALMVRTPVGPLRVDWGIRLGGEDDEPRSVVHFSVGHPY